MACDHGTSVIVIIIIIVIITTHLQALVSTFVGALPLLVDVLGRQRTGDGFRRGDPRALGRERGGEEC